MRYTAVETADATLTNLMDHAGVKTFIQNGILVRSSSLSRHLSPLGNVDCLEPPNCSPAGQTEFYFGGFDNPSVGTGTDVSVGFNPYLKVDVVAWSDTSFYGPSPFTNRSVGPTYSVHVPRAYQRCTTSLITTIAAAGVQIAATIRSNPSQWDPKVLFAAFQVSAGLLAPADFLLAVGGLLASPAFLFLLAAAGLAAIAYFTYLDCTAS